MRLLNKCTIGSDATTIFDLANEKIAKGEKVYNLAAGDPANIPICPALQESLIEVAHECPHGYGPAAGLKDLRDKVAAAHPEKVIITNGAKQALYMTLKAVAENGEVVIIGPVWSSYIEICKMLNIKYRWLIDPMTVSHEPDIFDIQAACSNRTNAIIINNPCNPTGHIYDSRLIHDLAMLAEWNNCYLIYDNIYADINYTDKRVANVNRQDKHIIEIGGVSKTYGVTGWRLGWAVAAPEVITLLTQIQSQMSGPPNILPQAAVLKAWNKMDQIDIDTLKERRDFIASITPLLDKYKPDAGFYFYLPIHTNDSAQFCHDMMNEFNIMLVPGDSYGVPNTVRLSFANISLDELKEIIPELSLFS